MSQDDYQLSLLDYLSILKRRALLIVATFGGVFAVAVAENARIPVDNPATHLELTMVHEAMILEASGRHLALWDFAAQLRLLALSLVSTSPAPSTNS